MSEHHFNITLDIVDWLCEYCNTYCKPTGEYKNEFIGIQVEHMCMNPSCGMKVLLPMPYPKWESITESIIKNRPK